MRRIITLWIVAIAACGKPAAQSSAREDSQPAPSHDQPVAAGGANEEAPAPTPEPPPADAATPAAPTTPATPARPNPAEPAKPSRPAPAKPDTAKPADPAPTGNSGNETLPGQTEKCTADGKCAAGLTCKTYYGIAGPRGPKFTSCEIPCSGKASSCPKGQSCTTIADGPGQVCRP